MRTEIAHGDGSDAGVELLGRFGQLEWHRRQRSSAEVRRQRYVGGDRSNTPSEVAEENTLAVLHSLSGEELPRVGSPLPPLSDAHSGRALPPPPPPLSDAHAAAADANSSGTPSMAAQWRRIDAAAAAADGSNTPPPSGPRANGPRSPPPLPPQPPSQAALALAAGLSSREIFATFQTPGSRRLTLTLTHTLTLTLTLTLT